MPTKVTEKNRNRRIDEVVAICVETTAKELTRQAREGTIDAKAMTAFVHLLDRHKGNKAAPLPKVNLKSKDVIIEEDTPVVIPPLPED